MPLLSYLGGIMSWSQDRLAALSQRHSYRTISRETGIPVSSISYVIRGQRKLPSKHIRQLRNYYSRDVYAQLRSAGLNPRIARRYRWFSTAHQQEFIEEASDVVEQLAGYRLEQYREYLIKQGRYTSDEDTMNILRDAIRDSLGKSPIDLHPERMTDTPVVRTLIRP